ncbi:MULTISPECIES: NadS family protein [Endozoicomonas]|uniref:Helix-turn-helix domain-containing protein n=2 Tax=Endozoicomonas TaxID=305899 RepID=A0ABY6GSC0_9GAMM|nr:MULTISPECIES: NadS family protein [Endozoicomonas]MCW7552282.1 helix-turn-helix domain-containing protein [Endozoicomonas gorgoniicola]UYM15652.1 helix-turn-helix domain-containing protein [Endozoicomonas euniceicola]
MSDHEFNFDELVESVREAIDINKGIKKPSRTFQYEEIDVASIRKATHLSQEKFAALIGVSIKTVQSWEQKVRKPLGPARSLLIMFRNNPVQAMNLLHQ